MSCGFPIRQEIEVLPADEPRTIKFDEHIIITSKNKTLRANPNFVLGWTVKESIGVAVVNTRGVSKGRKSVVIGS